MLPEASAEGNIPTKGEQHACYMAEHLTIDLLYHYHLDNMYTCNITGFSCSGKKNYASTNCRNCISTQYYIQI